jgi:hypothetical protein
LPALGGAPALAWITNAGRRFPRALCFLPEQPNALAASEIAVGSAVVLTVA